MEYGNFDPIRFEQPDETAGESKHKSKKKKPGVLSPATPSPEAGKTVKKEAVAKQAESLWGRLIGEKPKVEPDGEVKDLPSEVSIAEDTSQVEAPEVHDTDMADIELLDADEERYALEAYLDTREIALQGDSGEDEPPESALARQANLAFLAAVRQNLEHSEAGVNPVDEAFDRVARGLDSEIPEIDIHEPTSKQVVSSVVSSPLPRRPDSASGYRTVELSPAAGQDLRMSQAEQMPETVYIRQNTASNFLVGGVIGYVLGRRRGRIKTEKRLVAVQKKLEKQINTVQRRVVDREIQIQRLVREKVSAGPTVPETDSRSRGAVVPEKRPSKTIVPPERLKRSAETTPAAARMETARAASAPRPEQAPRQAELSSKDVLALSEKITIGATNLRQVYETKLIGESGLRRLVYEHLEGRDIRRALAREFLVKELSFERDPRLRDSLLGTETLPDTKSGATHSKATQDSPAHSVVSAQLTDDSSRSQPLPDRKSSDPKSTVSTGLLTALALLALGLAVYAVFLSMNR